MLKSLEMKAEIKSLREKIQALIDQKKAVPVEMQNKLQDALSDYEKAARSRSCCEEFQKQRRKQHGQEIF